MFMYLLRLWRKLMGKKTQIIAIIVSTINVIIMLCDNGVIQDKAICDIAKTLLSNTNQINAVGVSLMAITLGSRIKRIKL